MFHHPVLLNKVIAHLNVRKGGLYIDATFGEGGHTMEILRRGGKVLGIDWDRDQYQISNTCLPAGTVKYQIYTKTKNLILTNDNFKNIEKVAKENDFYPVDGIIFDLGLSMRQINKSGRGFSYKNESEPLDMRLDARGQEKAADFINNLSEQSLYEIFSKNAEELNSWSIARAIVCARKIKKIMTVGDLNRVIEKAVGRKDNFVRARIFQALRIAVNHEFDNIKEGLKGAVRLIKNDGRILVITFHSGEDRIVKVFVKENGLKFATKKPVTSKSNFQFERSAKLRIITK